MPAGTPPGTLMAAVRNFAEEQFADRHRCALSLHTDEPHPHVHMVLKATAEGRLYDLNIRKPMLREWRQEFAPAICVPWESRPKPPGEPSAGRRRGCPGHTDRLAAGPVRPLGISRNAPGSSSGCGRPHGISEIRATREAQGYDGLQVDRRNGRARLLPRGMGRGRSHRCQRRLAHRVREWSKRD